MWGPTANINYSDYGTRLHKSWGAMAGSGMDCPMADHSPFLHWLVCPLIHLLLLSSSEAQRQGAVSEQMGGRGAQLCAGLSHLARASPGYHSPARVWLPHLSGHLSQFKVGHHVGCGVVKNRKPHPSF